MRWRAALRSIVLGVLVGALGAAPVPARAHSGYFGNYWTPPNGAQIYAFTSSVPTGNFRDRVREGVPPWNNRGERVYFTEGAPIGNFTPSACPPSTTANGIHYGAFDGVGNVAAKVWACTYGSDILTANMLFDSAEPWFSLPSGGPSASEMDVRSTATHEWGHMLGGWLINPGPGHFGSDVCVLPAGSATDQTMCPGILKGSTYGRTLEVHDTHSFEIAYAPTWFLSNTNTGTPSLITPFEYGIDDDGVMTCDWDGSGTGTPGIFRGNTFYLNNGFTNSTATSFNYGLGGDLGICGDWNGDGVDTIGVYRPSTSEWYLNDQNDSSGAEYAFTYGSPGDVPVVGNWDGSFGSNAVTVGVSRGTAWYLNNQNDSSGPEYSFTYGSSGDIPVVGNWDGSTTNRDDTVGVYRGGSWYLNNQNDNSAADVSFAFGGALDTPVPANFDGSASNKSDTAGLVRGR